MDDAFLMGSFNTLSNLAADFQSLFDGHRTFGNTLSKGFTWDQLQGKKAHTICLFQAVNGCDVGMIE